jgi:hypothetical protein
MLLTSLTRDRSPEVLDKLRAKALPALIEMAQWRNPGHAAGPLRLLGRIAGIDESELDKLADAGNARTGARGDQEAAVVLWSAKASSEAEFGCLSAGLCRRLCRRLN